MTAILFFRNHGNQVHRKLGELKFQSKLVVYWKNLINSTNIKKKHLQGVGDTKLFDVIGILFLPLFLVRYFVYTQC